MIVMPLNQKESVVGAEKSNAFVSPKRKRPTQEILDIPSFALALPTTTTTTMEAKVNVNSDKFLQTPEPWKNKSILKSDKTSFNEQSSTSKPSKNIGFLSPSIGQSNTYSSYTFGRNTRTSALTPKRHRNLSETKPPINFQDTPAPKCKEKQEKEVKDEVNAPESPLYSPFRFNSFPDSLPRVNPRSVRPLFADTKNDTDRDGPESLGRVLFGSGDISEFSPSNKEETLNETKTPNFNFSIGLSSSFQPSAKKKSIVRKGTTINSFKNFIEGHNANSIQKHEVDTPYSQSWSARPQEWATDTSHDTSISSISATSPVSINGGMMSQKPTSPLALDEKSYDNYLRENKKIPVQYANAEGIDSPPFTIEKVKGTRLNFNSLLSPGPNGVDSEEEAIISQSKVNDCKPGRLFASPSNSDNQEHNKACMNIGELPSSPCSPICNEDDGSCSHSIYSNLVLDVEFASTLRTARRTSLGSDASAEDSSCRENNFSTLSSTRLSISPSSKSKTLRPMPDMTAFDGTTTKKLGRSSLSTNNDDLQSSTPPRRFVCPPTPWRSRCSPKLTRQDSLNAPKLLAACPPNILDCLTSFEASIDENMNMSTVSSLGNAPLHGEFLNSSGSTGNEERNKSMEGSSGGVDNKAGTSTEQIDIHSKNSKAIEARHLPMDTASFNDFENLGLIGQGSFADVFKVRCKADNCLYAVKRNRRQFRGKRDRDLTLVEVHTMQRLQSDKKVCPYLLLFVRAWQEDGYFFCQTELCCTENCRHMLLSLRNNWRNSSRRHLNLSENMSPNGSIDPSSRLTPETTVWKIFHDVAAGLSHIHSHGLVHFDIKPSNIFFVAHCKLGCICKIGDFGMAGEIGSSEDGQEGDAKYMPQEVLSTAVKHPSADIFSLGLTIYELCSDVQWELPSDGPRWHEIRDGKHPINLPSSRSKELITSIQMMIHPDKLKRPAADQILDDNKIKEAGLVHDVFLADYLREVQDLEFERERREASFRRSTPTSSINLGNGERNWNVRTPTPEPNIHFFPVQSSK